MSSSLSLPCTVTDDPIASSARRRAGAALGRPSCSLRHHRQQQQQARIGGARARQGAQVVSAATTTSSTTSSHDSSSMDRRRRAPPLPLPLPLPSPIAAPSPRRANQQRRRPQSAASAANAAGGEGQDPADGPDNQAARTNFPFALPQLPTPSWPPSAVGRVMALWLLAYLFLGRVFVPLLAALGLPLQAHPAAGAGGGGVALAHLALDAAQLGCTCLILRLSLGQPWRSLRQQGLFSFEWRRAREWIPAVLIGCLAFPIVGWAARWAAAAGLDASAAAAPPLPIEGDAVSAGGSLVLEAGVAAAAAPGGGGAAAAAALGYALVVAVCAPLWEEAVFRGFLLPSLAAYAPSFGGGGGDGGKGQQEGKGGQGGGSNTAASVRAVVLSAAAFAGCHFRADTALPMFLLGLLFGGACVATGGRLAAPVALHGLWNLWAVAHSAVAA